MAAGLCWLHRSSASQLSLRAALLREPHVIPRVQVWHPQPWKDADCLRAHSVRFRPEPISHRVILLGEGWRRDVCVALIQI